MLFGLPVVAMSAGGLPEVIEHGVTGLVAAEPSLDLLSGNAVLLMRDPTRAVELGRQGAALARRRHLWEHALPGILAVYAEVV
jgi:glycosyltransferase involved in cell wall biosynthesis